jgi:hypothetical protein
MKVLFHEAKRAVSDEDVGVNGSTRRHLEVLVNVYWSTLSPGEASSAVHITVVTKRGRRFSSSLESSI